MSNNKIQIIIDSTTNLAEEFMQHVTVIPLTVAFGTKEYLDDIDLSRDEFYEKLESEDCIPTTSQPSPAAFEKAFEEVRQNGADAIVITVASELSGTYQSACIAAEDYPEVTVIDSRSVAIGTGILVEYAIQCLQNGMEKEELVDTITKKREDICLLAMLDTVKYLVKGGRLSKTSAIAVNMLNIKPVIAIKDGVIVGLGKARGSKRANNLLVEHVREKGIDFELPVLLAYSGRSKEILDNYINDNRDLWSDHVKTLSTSQLCSVIGTHAGPGAIAAAFFAKK